MENYKLDYLMHTYTLLIGFKPSSMLQEIVFSLQNVMLDLEIEHQTITMFHGLPFCNWECYCWILYLHGWVRILIDD